MVLCVQEVALVHGLCVQEEALVHGVVCTGGSSSAWCCVYRR